MRVAADDRRGAVLEDDAVPSASFCMALVSPVATWIGKVRVHGVLVCRAGAEEEAAEGAADADGRTPPPPGFLAASRR